MERVSPRVPRWRLLACGAFCLVLVGLLVLGTVQVRAGAWIGRRLSVARIWDAFLGFLRDQGASPAVVALVAIAAIAALLGSLLLLWLAFGLRDADREAPGDDVAVR